MRHLAARPAVSATHLVGEELAVTVHGRAELFELSDPVRGELRQVLAWTLIWRYSVTAAVVMSAVALVVPPLAAIVANAGPLNRQ